MVYGPKARPRTWTHHLPVVDLRVAASLTSFLRGAPKDAVYVRKDAVPEADYNLFKLLAQEVTIDLLTDSGTGAMSAEQWSALMRGDETYAGSRSFQRLQEVTADLTGYRHIFPVHQGRAAERIMAATVLAPGKKILNNTHFDTTRANIEQAGAEAVDLPCERSRQTHLPAAFKGDIDLEALDQALEHQRESIALVMLTLTNNAVGGQPVSMANIARHREHDFTWGQTVWAHWTDAAHVVLTQ